jgi:hypothetical protein
LEPGRPGVLKTDIQKIHHAMSDETVPATIEMNAAMLRYLNTTRKWSKFFAVLGFIMLGLMVLLGFSIGIIMNMIPQATPMPTTFPTMLFGMIYLIFSVIYFFPLLFLYRFASAAKRGIKASNGVDIENAFRHLRDHFSYMGVLTIVMLSMYIIMIVVVVIAVIFIGVNLPAAAGLA